VFYSSSWSRSSLRKRHPAVTLVWSIVIFTQKHILSTCSCITSLVTKPDAPENMRSHIFTYDTSEWDSWCDASGATTCDGVALAQRRVARIGTHACLRLRRGLGSVDLMDLQSPIATTTSSTSRDPFELERLADELEAREHSIDAPAHDLPSIPHSHTTIPSSLQPHLM